MPRWNIAQKRFADFLNARVSRVPLSSFLKQSSFRAFTALRTIDTIVSAAFYHVPKDGVSTLYWTARSTTSSSDERFQFGMCASLTVRRQFVHALAMSLSSSTTTFRTRSSHVLLLPRPSPQLMMHCHHRHVYARTISSARAPRLAGRLDFHPTTRCQPVTHTHINTYTHTNTHTHINTYTHTNTHTHINTHKHIASLGLWKGAVCFQRPWATTGTVALSASPSVQLQRRYRSSGIVGLPNVGKSTLFNALTRTQVRKRYMVACIHTYMHACIHTYN